MADGGEGTVQSVTAALNGSLQTVKVLDPLGREIEAVYGLSGNRKVAIIEMAAASGLHLVAPHERNPLQTTSFGTGQLIAAALEQGVEKIVLGLGGSATNDGGAGMAQALGARLVNNKGEAIAFGGGALSQLASIHVDEMHPRLKEVEIKVACDVDNPLLGETGASSVYGPQKGASAEMIEELDRCLAHYGKYIWEQLGIEVRSVAGAGAAGGLGAGILAFLNGKLDSGVQLVLEAVDFATRIKGAELVITGEGRLDQQTIFGKTPIGVAKAAKKKKIAWSLRLQVAFSGL